MAASLQALIEAPCPDCNADIEIRRITNRVRVIYIKHDQTCPTYKPGGEEPNR